MMELPDEVAGKTDESVSAVDRNRMAAHHAYIGVCERHGKVVNCADQRNSVAAFHHQNLPMPPAGHPIPLADDFCDFPNVFTTNAIILSNLGVLRL